MARLATVTQEQVNAVADNIKASGGKLTSRAIREQLGAGSTTTILRYFQVWQGGQIRQSQVVEDVVDTEIINAISNQIARRIQEATSKSTSQIVDLQAEIADVMSESERQLSEIETQSEELSILQTQCSTYAGRVQQLELEAGRAVADILVERQAAETARIALAKAELRLEAVPRIEAEILAVRSELLLAQKLASEQHEAAAVAIAKLDSAEKNAVRLTEQLAVTSKSADEAAKRTAAALEQLNDARVSIITLQSRIDAFPQKKTNQQDSSVAKTVAQKRGRPAKAKPNQLVV